MDELRHDSTLIVVDQLGNIGTISYIHRILLWFEEETYLHVLVMGKGYREPIRNATEQGHFDG